MSATCKRCGQLHHHLVLVEVDVKGARWLLCKSCFRLVRSLVLQ
jgi:hypothetical protein